MEFVCHLVPAISMAVSMRVLDLVWVLVRLLEKVSLDVLSSSLLRSCVGVELTIRSMFCLWTHEIWAVEFER